jgi:N-methylhydantoinase B
LLTLRAAAGDRFVGLGPGGGGYGDPLSREPQHVVDDVLDGLIDEETAARDYGVAIAGGRIDSEGTARLRGI